MSANRSPGTSFAGGRRPAAGRAAVSGLRPGFDAVQPEDPACVLGGSASDRQEVVAVAGEQVLEAGRCCLALRFGRRALDFTLRGEERRRLYRGSARPPKKYQTTV